MSDKNRRMEEAIEAAYELLMDHSHEDLEVGIYLRAIGQEHFVGSEHLVYAIASLVGSASDKIAAHQNKDHINERELIEKIYSVHYSEPNNKEH